MSWTTKGVLDRVVYLAAGGLGTFGFYHYKQKYEISRIPSIIMAEHSWNESYLQLKKSKVPQARQYNINLNRQVLETNYAQFIIDSTLHQLKSVINIAIAPQNCGKSTVLINAATIIADSLQNYPKQQQTNTTTSTMSSSNSIDINEKCLERFNKNQVFILYLNLEQGMKEAIRQSFNIQAKNELDAIMLLNLCLTNHITQNDCIILLLDSPSNFHLQSENSHEIQLKFLSTLKGFIDSGNGYVFCLTSDNGCKIFQINEKLTLDSNRINAFQDDRFFLTKNEQLALIDACTKYNGEQQFVDVVSNAVKDTTQNGGENVGVDQLYQLMCEDEQITKGIIGDTFAYLNQVLFSVDGDINLHESDVEQ